MNFFFPAKHASYAMNIHKEGPKEKNKVDEVEDDEMGGKMIATSRMLVSVDKYVRNRGFKKMEELFESQTSLQDIVFVKMWKVLHYAAWLCDKPLKQRDLFVRIGLSSRKIQLLKNRNKFFYSFFKIMIEQWALLDNIRMNKYLLLFRILYAEIIYQPLTFHWPLEEVLDFGKIIFELLLEKASSRGLGMHLCDIFINELMETLKAIKNKLSPSRLSSSGATESSSSSGETETCSIVKHELRDNNDNQNNQSAGNDRIGNKKRNDGRKKYKEATRKKENESNTHISSAKREQTVTDHDKINHQNSDPGIRQYQIIFFSFLPFFFAISRSDDNVLLKRIHTKVITQMYQIKELNPKDVLSVLSLLSSHISIRSCNRNQLFDSLHTLEESYNFSMPPQKYLNYSKTNECVKIIEKIIFPPQLSSVSLKELPGNATNIINNGVRNKRKNSDTNNEQNFRNQCEDNDDKSKPNGIEETIVNCDNEIFYGVDNDDDDNNIDNVQQSEEEINESDKSLIKKQLLRCFLSVSNSEEFENEKAKKKKKRLKKRPVDACCTKAKKAKLLHATCEKGDELPNHFDCKIENQREDIMHKNDVCRRVMFNLLGNSVASFNRKAPAIHIKKNKKLKMDFVNDSHLCSSTMPSPIPVSSYSSLLSPSPTSTEAKTGQSLVRNKISSSTFPLKSILKPSLVLPEGPSLPEPPDYLEGDFFGASFSLPHQWPSSLPSILAAFERNIRKKKMKKKKKKKTAAIH